MQIIRIDVYYSERQICLPYADQMPFYSGARNGRYPFMWQISLIIFLSSFAIFTGIMLFEPRTLKIGVSFFFMMLCLALFSFFLLSEYADCLGGHDAVIFFLVVLLILAVIFVIVFPGLLILLFFIEGVRVLRHEGLRPSNLLSMLFSILLFVYLFIWPRIGKLAENTPGTAIYIIISFSAIYLLTLMAIYSLSAILNLIHVKKRRKLDYIIILGAGIKGKKVTPLLAARIEKGIQLLRYNPDATLIMSGGKGPGEEIPESEAMAAYALDKNIDAGKIIMEETSTSTEENLLFSRRMITKEKPKIAIVTTSYHVFRALLLAKQQKIKCIGFGARTKWYFTLNALIREYIGYLSLTRKRHIVTIGIFSCFVILLFAL